MATMMKERHHRRTHRRTQVLTQVLERRNVSESERGVRLLLGAFSTAAAAAVGLTWLKVVLGIMGISGLVTGATAYCPVNAALDRNTFRQNKK